MAMEEFKVSPWLYDDPKKKKIFSLAGFFGDVEKERQAQVNHKASAKWAAHP